jgi:hypothetical protein
MHKTPDILSIHSHNNTGMKYAYASIGSLVIACITFQAIASGLAATPAICEHIVLQKDRVALSVARAYYPGSVDAQITREEERKVVLQLTSMIEEYGKSHGDTEYDVFETRQVRRMVQQAKYHIQMVPLQMKGKRAVMLNLLGAQGVWREHYHSISDGGYNCCRVFVDLTTFKVLQIHCNGAG